MADIVTFPCEYLAYSTGYEDRLLDGRYVEEFSSFCIEHGVTLITIYDPWRLRRYQTNDTTAVFTKVIATTLIEEFVTHLDRTANELIARLERNQLQRPCVILRVGTFDKATEIFLKIRSIDYCTTYGIDSIKLLKNEQNIIDLAYVEINAESG